MKRRTIFTGNIIMLLSGPSAARAADLRAVKPPLAFPPDYWFLFGLPLLALAAVLWGVVRRWRRRARVKAARPVPPPPPWETAYRRLQELAASSLAAEGRVKAYYSELSDIARHYIEGRFEIRAPDMTTEEFLQSLKHRSELNARQKEALQQFLTCCDMVKFARFSATASEMEDSHALVRHFVDETRPAEPAAGTRAAGTPARGEQFAS